MIKKLAGLMVMGATFSAGAFEFSGEGNKIPLEINADGGISCDQEKKKCWAQGNVFLKKETTTLKADKAVVTFFEMGEKKKVSHFEVFGHVELLSTEKNEKVTASRGMYDLEKGVVVFTGPEVHLTTDSFQVIAHEQIDFNEKTLEATATGKAIAWRGSETLTGDVLKVFFVKDPSGKLRVKTVSSFGKTRLEGVNLSLQEGQAHGHRLDVDADKEKSILTGQGPNRVKVLLLPHPEESVKK